MEITCLAGGDLLGIPLDAFAVPCYVHFDIFILTFAEERKNESSKFAAICADFVSDAERGRFYAADRRM